mmetsp:Transcript_10817/g.35521  ORF Transcript_10817/g.35521 Transcript_10817/m.35521 type:complete len:125 (-) Transcript_10817:723-1097(-)
MRSPRKPQYQSCSCPAYCAPKLRPRQLRPRPLRLRLRRRLRLLCTWMPCVRVCGREAAAAAEVAAAEEAEVAAAVEAAVAAEADDDAVAEADEAPVEAEAEAEVEEVKADVLVETRPRHAHFRL